MHSSGNGPRVVPTITPTVFYFASVSAWSGAALWFALSFAIEGLIFVVGCAMLITVLGTFRSANLGVILLPFPTLLGPMIPFQASGLGMITLADIQLITIAMAFLLVDRRLIKPIVFGPARMLLSALTASLLLSWASSHDLRSSTYTLANIAELLLLYLLTLNLVRTIHDIRKLLDAWVFAATLASALVLFRYVQGQPLLLSSDELAIVPTLDAATMAGILFRATHFYFGFFFVVSAVIVLIVAGFYDSQVPTPRRRYAMLAAVGICILTLLLMNTKSALYSTLMVIGAMMLWERLQTRRHSPYKPRRSRWTEVAIPILVAIVVLPLVLVAEQLDALGDRLSSIASLEQRLLIYLHALREIFGDIRILLLGLGPDTLIRAPHLETTSRILTDDRGMREGALDSTLLTILVEFGLVFASLCLGLVIFTLRLLYRKRYTFPRGIYLGIGGGLGVSLLTASVQYAGWSKTSWLLVQLVALAHLPATARFANVRMGAVRDPQSPSKIAIEQSTQPR